MFKALRALVALVFLVTFATLPLQSVKVTAYTNARRCTDSTPNIMASGLKINSSHYYRVIALSDDLAKGHRFGDRFELRIGDEVYVVVYEDRMAKRHRRTVDLFLPSLWLARKFGARHGELIPVD